jgi:hypothetical protein
VEEAGSKITPQEIAEMKVPQFKKISFVTLKELKKLLQSAAISILFTKSEIRPV